LFALPHYDKDEQELMEERRKEQESGERDKNYLPVPENRSTDLPENHSTCRRPCQKRINKIFYHNGRAGLRDREISYRAISNLAGYLCAVVEVPPPSSSLAPGHNGNIAMNAEAKWIDFFNITFLDDRSPALLDVRDNKEIRKGIHNWRRYGIYNQTSYPGWHIVLSKNNDNLLDHFKDIQDFSWNQSTDDETGFIWEIHRTYFEAKELLQEKLPGPSDAALQSSFQTYSDQMQPKLISSSHNSLSCNYLADSAEEMTPTELSLYREELRRRVQLHSPNETSLFGFFHIRRGDAMDACDTSLDKLWEFFRCSVNGTESKEKHVTLLFGSDEKNSTYRESVIDFQNFYPHISILDADQIVSNMMTEMIQDGNMPKRNLNNYYHYELLKTLGMDRQFEFSSVFLIRRRGTDCEPCTKLTKLYPAVWN